MPTVASKRQGAPVPQSLEDFFQKALAREKEDRFQSAQEFVDAMLDAVADVPPEELDALPTNSAPEVGNGSKPSQYSVSKPGRSSPSPARSRPGAPQRTPRSDAPLVPQRAQSLAKDTPRGLSGRKIALVAVPLVLIAAGGAAVALRPSTPVEPLALVAEVKKEPASAAPAVNSMLRVLVRSTPAGAAVFDGDVQIGTTPFERQLRRDVHELIFRLPAHQDLKRKLDFNGVMSDSQEVSVVLEPVKAAPAEPSRSSRPAKQGKSKSKGDAVPIFE